MARKTRATRYPIRTVASMTGLGLDTLRAWERRHKAITPTRDHRGRMYSEADVRRLRLLRGAIERGHSIGRATKLSNVELEALGVSLEPLSQTGATTAGASAISSFGRTAMSDALTRFDQTDLGTELGRAAALLRPLNFVSEVALPFLADVAERCRDESDGAADLHLASSAVRNVLGSMLHRYAGGAGARLLFATLDGDGYDLNVLGAAVLAASGGLDAVYLGAGVSANDVVSGACRAEADVVVLGMSDLAPHDRAVRELSAVVQGLSADVEIWIAGTAAGSVATRIDARVEALETFPEFVAHLTRIGARLA